MYLNWICVSEKSIRNIGDFFLHGNFYLPNERFSTAGVFRSTVGREQFFGTPNLNNEANNTRISRGGGQWSRRIGNRSAQAEIPGKNK